MQRPEDFSARNRNNALQSTGPRTTAGKARSSQNALRHGLNKPPGEADFQRWGSDLIGADFSPTDKLNDLREHLVVSPIELVEATVHLRRVRQQKLDLIDRLVEILKPRRVDSANDDEIESDLSEHDEDDQEEGETKRKVSRTLDDLRRLATYERKALSRWFSCFDKDRSRP